MKILPLRIVSIAAAFFLSAGLMAQEPVEVSVKIKKDGEVVKDTSYQFEDASEAEHAIKMMEVISGDDEHMEKIHYNYTTAHSDGNHSKAMVFISEDGEKTEIKEFHGDSLVWISEGEEPHGKHVVVMKSEDGNTFDILVDEDVEGGNVVKKKEIKVVVSDDEEGPWTVVEGDDDVKMKVMKIMEDEDEGEDVKVIVIKKAEKDCDHDEDVDHGEEHEHDEVLDHDVDVDVKVIKKKVKK